MCIDLEKHDLKLRGTTLPLPLPLPPLTLPLTFGGIPLPLGILNEAEVTGRGGILLYEIQGPWYFNSDVTAIVDNIRFTQIGGNRVSMCGVESAPPPATTKVGITAHGGFQAEMHYFLVRLDILAKARMFEQQVRH
ncbi:hypothetical protein C8F04DRAFT_1186282 [Mycena alexandri]|uniref:Acyclic terpene utilisation N-terminal domain-containing protein n=1 Tax=Mycena alexandri TaxID=1745969 RepID=A0AAD6SPH5_9AGAR|nr:hypothetical protein C8F04DRAFT_1186282 [Mycena alexandri]